MAELNYRERPTNITHLKLWVALSLEKPIELLSKDYNGSWLVIFKDQERRYVSELMSIIERKI